MALRSAKMRYQVNIAETKNRLSQVNAELAAMRPAPTKKDIL